MTRRPGTTLAAALVAAAASLSACSGGSGSSASAGSSSPSTSPAAGGSSTSSAPAGTSATPESPTSSSTSPSVVNGVRLTPQGSKLKVGDSAKVSWQPDQKTTGVIRVSVTELEQVPISTFSDFRLSPAIRRSTPYFVHATVRNLGKSDLSHVKVPLYLLDTRNTLIQSSTFLALFPPCPSRPLPASFTRGKRTSVCLVYFAPNHGKLVAISFRPTEDFDAITWTGKVTEPK